MLRVLFSLVVLMAVALLPGPSHALAAARADHHGRCTLVEMTEVPHRLFGNWWMGLAMRDSVTAPIFAPYLVNGALRVEDMKASDIVAMATCLASLAPERRMQAAA